MQTLSFSALLLLLGSFSLAFTARARAEQVRAKLSWQRPWGSHCPLREDLEADVESASDSATFVDDDTAEVLLAGTIQERAEGVNVTIEARSRDGKLVGARQLSAAAGECAHLRSSIALVLTVLLDSMAGQTQVERTDNAHASRVRVGAAASLLTGLLPRVTFGPSAVLRFAPRERLSLSAELTYWLPVRMETPRGYGAKLQALGFSGRLCPRLFGQSQRLSLWLCAGGQTGALISTPRRLDGKNRQFRALAQLLFEARLRLPLRTFALESALGVVGSVQRTRFEYERNDGSRAFLFRSAPVGIFFSLGVIKL